MSPCSLREGRRRRRHPAAKLTQQPIRTPDVSRFHNKLLRLVNDIQLVVCEINQHLFNQAHPLKQLIRLAGIQSQRLFGDAGAISCVNSSIYSAAPPVRDGRWLLSTVYCTNPAHPDSVQIPIIDANNAGKCRVKIYACKCLCPIFDLRILPASPKKEPGALFSNEACV